MSIEIFLYNVIWNTAPNVLAQSCLSTFTTDDFYQLQQAIASMSDVATSTSIKLRPILCSFCFSPAIHCILYNIDAVTLMFMIVNIISACSFMLLGK